MFDFELKNAVILDTETTGTGIDDEVIELAIIDADTGATLFNERFKPNKVISDEAYNIHGITNGSLVGKPQFRKHFDKIANILTSNNIIGWNVFFDELLIKQTIAKQHIEKELRTNLCDFKVYYVIDYLNEKDFQQHSSIHLITACEIEKIDISDLIPHQALSDCQMLYRLIHKIKGDFNG